jgi:antitoxin component YwqK of YwqJK toxin-antitoxin module
MLSLKVLQDIYKMQYQKRGYIKTYDENGKLLSKVPMDSVEVEQDEAPAEEADEVVESGDE